MKPILPSIGLAVTLTVTAASHAFAASPAVDCDTLPPQADVPGSATTDQAPNQATDDTLTERLATCGSVLDPPAIGDRDMVEPAPRIGRDMNLHPQAPAGQQ
ncbi:MAG: hypothetical protein KL863_09825 [Rhizobium sp.]|nr:hypothetical protein [Rhizobium sp.]